MATQVADDTSLGWVRIGGLRAGPEGRARVDVTFKVTAGTIALTAFDPADQRLLPILPAGPPVKP
jgi:molecular chaperone DnaK (HSP70)